MRTDTSKKHEGISFVLINMHQPGVETRPIKLIAGNSPFCETFFTDARAEKDDMVGPLNSGWTVDGLDDKGRIADPDLRTRITRHLIDAKAHMLTLARAAT